MYRSKKTLLALAIASATALSASATAADNAAPHFTKHTDMFKPTFEIQGFSFMPGAAVIDINNDGYEDLFLANGKGYPNALYKNKRGKGFKKVRSAGGLGDLGQTTGIAVGDLNNDGYDDLYVGAATTIGDGVDSDDGIDRIYLSNGKSGTFTDITATSGINEVGFTSSIAMADYDKDGYLDIFVGRFIDFDFFNPVANRTNPTKRGHLYRNNGDNTFTNVTVEANLDYDINTWSVVWVDYDNDSWVDLVVGREQGPVSIYRNTGDGKFKDMTSQAGDVAEFGAWMGLTVGDFDNDGDFDIFGTNISDLWDSTRDPELPALPVPPAETWDNPRSTLFRNNGDGTFTDANTELGLPDDMKFGWGAVSGDFNNDGWLDFYAAQNFAPVGVIGRERNGASPGSLYINKGDGTFADHSYLAGIENFDAKGNYLDARGVVSADFNHDGRLDVYLVNAPQFEEDFPMGKTKLEGTSKGKLFKNKTRKGNWLELNLVGTGKSNRNAIGAVVEIFTGEGYQKRTVVGGGSAFSSSSRVIHVGLGKSDEAKIVVYWPDGSTEIFNGVQSGEAWNVIQGKKHLKKRR